MRPISRYIDDAINDGIIRSDADLAKKLGVSRSAVHYWRIGEKAPSEDQAAALANLLGKMEILAQSMVKRTKTEEGRSTWEKAVMMLSKATACCIAASIGLLSMPQNAEASQCHGQSLQTRTVKGNVMHIMVFSCSCFFPKF